MIQTNGYLFDTDWASYWMRQRPSSVIEAVRQLPQDRLFLSIVSLAELYFGAFYHPPPERIIAGIDRFLRGVEILTLTPAISQRYGQLKALLWRQGNRIPDIDLFIAATAVEHNLTLLTNNRRHFERVSGLEIISA